MNLHPLAEIFPRMSDQELAELVEDIRTNGQLEPIVTYEGMILDGRHRWLACEELGIDPKCTEYAGSSPAHYVCSKNLRRRNMSPAQKAAVGAELEPTLAEEARKRKAESAASRRLEDGTLGPMGTDRSPQAKEQGKSAYLAAQAVGSDKKSIQAAKQVKQAAESGDEIAKEAWAEMKAGKTTIADAKRRVSGGPSLRLVSPDKEEERAAELREKEQEQKKEWGLEFAERFELLHRALDKHSDPQQVINALSNSRRQRMKNTVLPDIILWCRKALEILEVQ